MIVEESGRILLNCNLLNHTGSSRHNRLMDRASVKVGWESFPSGRCVRALASTKTGMRYDGSVGCHPTFVPAQVFISQKSHELTLLRVDMRPTGEESREQLPEVL